MIAGSGSNLHQQFGFPIWFGALICTALVIIVSFMDFEKITNIIGIFTPIIIIMIIIIAGQTFIGKSYNFNQLDMVARQLTPAMPNIWMAVINYFALCVMTGVSMAFVLGGSIMRIGVAKKSGAIGGAIVGLIIAIASLVLFANVDIIKGVDIPMLILANRVHPLFAFTYAIVIFGLIFNTAFSLFYALAKRFSGDNMKKFRIYLITSVIIGFILSFMGFKELVGLMYPILGYIGMMMLFVLTVAWIRDKQNINKEMILRRQMITLINKKFHPKKVYSKKIKKNLTLWEKNQSFKQVN